MPGVSLNATQILRREDFQLHILSPGKIRSDLAHQDPSVAPNLKKRLSEFNNITNICFIVLIKKSIKHIFLIYFYNWSHSHSLRARVSCQSCAEKSND